MSGRSNNIYLILSVFIILFFSQTVHPDVPFHLSLDHAQYLGSDNQYYLEIYYSYPENAPKFLKNENNEFGSQVYFTLNIFQNDSLWATKQWKVEKQLPDTTALANSKKHMVDLIRYPVSGGRQYAIHLFALDYHSGKTDSIKTTLTGRSFTENQVCFSDLLIASSIEPFSQTSDAKFRKKAYAIVPNPHLSFGIDLHELYYYFEIYHLTQAKPDSEYAILWQVQDSTGQVVLANINSLDWRKLVYESSREIGQIGAWELKNGSYTLSCYFVTHSGQFAEISNSKKFIVYKTEEPAPASDLPAMVMQPVFLEGFDEGQLKLEFDQMYALTTKDIRKMYDNLKTPEEKKNQIYNLWIMGAYQVGMSVEEFRDKFLQRISEADEKYKNAFKPGWKTDQGMVFLKYGPPSDIDRHHTEAGTKPYEIWKYDNLEGGVIFIFSDRRGFNQFELIHSTKRGELSDPNWQRYIATSPQNRY